MSEITLRVAANLFDYQALLRPADTNAPAWHERVDDLERRMLSEPLVDQPLVHVFAGDMYVRSVVNPRGSAVTTKIHKTQHPFFVLRGVAMVSAEDGSVIEVEAPYFDVTQPGTRRVIYAVEEVQWVTVHAMTAEERDEPDVDRRLAMIEERIIERRELDDGRTSHELFWDAYERQQLATSEGQVSIEDIEGVFRQPDVLAPFCGMSEDEIFVLLREEAAAAMVAAGSPSDHPLDDRVGRVIARRLWLRSQRPDASVTEPPIGDAIRSAQEGRE